MFHRRIYITFSLLAIISLFFWFSESDCLWYMWQNHLQSILKQIVIPAPRPWSRPKGDDLGVPEIWVSTGFPGSALSLGTPGFQPLERTSPLYPSIAEEVGISDGATSLTSTGRGCLLLSQHLLTNTSNSYHIPRGSPLFLAYWEISTESSRVQTHPTPECILAVYFLQKGQMK